MSDNRSRELEARHDGAQAEALRAEYAAAIGGNGRAVVDLEAHSGRKPIPTDLDLAGRWIAAHPGTAWGLGDWRRYAGGCWPVVAEDAIRGEILATLKAAQAEGVRPSGRLLGSVLELARVELARPAESWDSALDILVCRNGALHIPTRTLLPHNPDHLATTALPFDFDPQATAAHFEYVLASCAPDAAEFLQEFFGYALTGDTSHEASIWLFSPPGGGKSTILTGIQAAFGARAGLLGLADVERSRFALTGVAGKTLLVSSEQPASFLQATHILNALISGEPITVDRKFRDPVTIVPRAKIAWAMNELPRVATAGSGLFRRVRVVEFHQVPEGDRDPAIKEAVKLEGAGILNWALAGLERLRARGRFNVPGCVTEATENFRANNDVPGAFVAENCTIGPDYRISSSELYGAYKTWCLDSGHRLQSTTSIADDWRRLGFQKYLANGRVWWRGVGLRM